MHTLAAGLSTTGLQDFIKTSVISVLVLFAAVAVLMLSRKKDNKGAIEVLIGVIVAAVVFAAASGNVLSNLGTSLLSMVGLQ